ncbi:MAG: serine/threonine protein kinase [Phycisphaerales bacterium]
MGPLSGFLGLVLGVLAIVLCIVVLVMIFVPLIKGIGWLIAHLWRFVSGVVTDAFRVVGAVLAVVVFSVLVVLNIVIGRWSGASHFGTNVAHEFKTMGLALYRILLGHPARLLGLSSLTEGIEKRVPAAIAQAPIADVTGKRTAQFEGYTIIGTLPVGGSGARLYIADPDPVKRAAFERQGHTGVDRVVIKSFSLSDGSQLPQIVRESRSLEAAKRMGLILDHDLSAAKFFYVMRYVPGESLAAVTRQLHAESGPEGLNARSLKRVLGYSRDLVQTLDGYHRGGLWHKDVKPDNIIVEREVAQLVDFGLVTSLHSAMTLTTHGTEYFRDPDLVRMALKGVKVSEVDGTRFDVFAAGAVLYSMLEDSFPAHGVMSTFSKRSPEAVRWIVRRAMTDYDKRYTNARVMLDDLNVVLLAADPFAVRPVDLPSMRGGQEAEFAHAPAGASIGSLADEPRAAVAVGMGVGSAVESPAKVAPKVRLKNWWTGASEMIVGEAPAGPRRGNAAATVVPPPIPAGAPSPSPFTPPPPPVPGPGDRYGRRITPVGERAPASEQLRRARERAEAAQARIAGRRGSMGHATGRGSSTVGVAAGVGVGLGVIGLLGTGVYSLLASYEGGTRLIPHATATREIFPTPAAIAGSAGRALVVSDVMPPLAPKVEARIVAAEMGLLDAGFELVGNTIVPGRGPSSIDEKATLELLAQARTQRGTTALDDDSLANQFAEWLESHPDLRLVVWVQHDTEKPEAMQFHVYSASGVEAQTASALAHDAIVHATREAGR